MTLNRHGRLPRHLDRREFRQGWLPEAEQQQSQHDGREQAREPGPHAAVPLPRPIRCAHRHPSLRVPPVHATAPDPRARSSALAIHEPGGSRTHDLRIKSPLLYQLSYRLVPPLDPLPRRATQPQRAAERWDSSPRKDDPPNMQPPAHAPKPARAPQRHVHALAKYAGPPPPSHPRRGTRTPIAIRHPRGPPRSTARRGFGGRSRRGRMPGRRPRTTSPPSPGTRRHPHRARRRFRGRLTPVGTAPRRLPAIPPEQLELLEPEGQAMMGRGAEAPDRGAVFLRAVAHVALPAVPGMAAREAGHETVPAHLGDDGGAGHRVHLGVAADHRLVLVGEVAHPQAIHHHMVRPTGQSSKRPDPWRAPSPAGC